MSMDRSWMYERVVNRELNPEFVAKLNDFVEFACSHPQSMDGDKIRCPCIKCKNCKYLTVDVVKLHLLQKGFINDYFVWSRHGETRPHAVSPVYEQQECYETFGYVPDPIEINETNNPYRTMVMEAAGPNFDTRFEEESPNPTTQHLYDMLRAAEQELWPGSSHSQLSAVSRMLTIKSEHNLSERCFDDLSKFIKEALPSNNMMASNFYETKKLVEGLGLPVEEIHCCEDGCMIYWEEDSELTSCKFCQKNRYKPREKGDRTSKKNVPCKKMYYFPLTPRLQRLYQSNATANDMKWHACHQQEDGMMSHPSDSEAWKQFNDTHPTFAYETRNVRLGLCTDGFTVFGQYGQPYSSWPVIVTIYNLPPWLCMKEQFMFLTVICPGPRNPKHKIDVFLQPLIAELQHLWTVGVWTYDVSLKQNFLLRAALMWTISDFPAYSMLSGWSTAGKLACPQCMEDSDAFYLPKGMKMSWFDNHRKFLPREHSFRKNKTWFLKNHIVMKGPTRIKNGHEILSHIDQLGLVKVTELGGEKHNAKICRLTGCGWKKRSIFWDLPYWSSNLIRHNLDVMHIEKNVFENIFNTVMCIVKKTKDNAYSREDLLQFCDRKELAWDETIGKYPRASYQLEQPYIQAIGKWVRSLKFPDGFVSNISRCVDKDNGTFKPMKSHDCHVFMQRLMPIAFRPFLPKNVWEALTELSLFFRDLTSATLSIEQMWRLETDIPVILCKLERIFPPSFFDSMEHLPVHLPYEARVAGPVQYRWMYPFERYLGHLKKSVKNKAHVEGSMANAYLTEEAALFCSHYFEPHVHTRHRKVTRNDDGGMEVETIPRNLSIFTYPGRPSGKCTKRRLDPKERMAAHTYIILNCPEINHYVRFYIQHLEATRPGINAEGIDGALDSEFANWFRKYVHENGEENQFIIDLAAGPLNIVESYPMYFVNGYRFHSMDYVSNKTSKNSGVCVKGTNYSESSVDYYGRLIEVLVLEYPRLPIKKTTLFKCEWYDPTLEGMKVHKKYNLVDVHENKRLRKYEPFILAIHAAQVCFVPYPTIRRKNSEWLAICKVKSKSIFQLPMSNVATQEDGMAFQEEEINRQPIPIDDNTIPGPLNYPQGSFVEIDEGNDTVEDEALQNPSYTDEEDESDESNNENSDDE